MSRFLPFPPCSRADEARGKVDVLLLHRPFTVSRILFFPIASLIAYNLYGNYYYVVTVDPGNPLSVLGEVRDKDPSMLRGGQEVGRGLGRKGMKACGKCGGPKPVVRTPFDTSGGLCSYLGCSGHIIAQCANAALC